MQSGQAKNIRILGIDPGSTTTGWGIVEEKSNVLELIECGAIKPPKGEFSQRLCYIYEKLSEICREYKPDEMAIENVFVARNAASALKLGQARGIALAAAFAHKIPTFDYEPTKVKMAVIGYGRAEKEQLAFMVHTMLNVKKLEKPLDTTDALAVAICHINSRKLLLKAPN